MRASTRSRLIALVRAQWAGLLALFLVIAGGTAYAANTVGSSDIIDESIQSVDVKNGQVKAPDLANNAVTSAKVADGEVKTADLASNSVRSQNIAAGQVQSGDVRDENLTGADIANNSIRTDDLDFQSVGWEQLDFGAVSTFAYKSQAATASNTSQVKELTVTCDGGANTDKVTGGGYVVEGTDAYIHRSYAVDYRSWLVRAASVSPTPGNWKLTVVADCLA